MDGPIDGQDTHKESQTVEISKEPQVIQDLRSFECFTEAELAGIPSETLNDPAELARIVANKYSNNPQIDPDIIQRELEAFFRRYTA